MVYYLHLLILKDTNEKYKTSTFYLISGRLLQPGVQRQMKSSERWILSHETFLAQSALSAALRSNSDRAVSAKHVTAISKNKVLLTKQNLFPACKAHRTLLLLQKLDVLVCFRSRLNGLLDLVSQHCRRVADFL